MLYIDYETRSSVDLKKYGHYAYTASPDFAALMCTWAHDDDDFELAVGEDEILQIPGLSDPDVVKVAHHAAFERVVTSVLLGQRYLDPSNWLCTQALAGEWGYPQSLAALAKALGAEDKDTAGTRLINLFCKPRHARYGGGYWRPEDKPEQWEQFKAYCVQDGYTLRDVHRRLPDWPNDFERQLYIVDQKINDRGIRVDVPLARAAMLAAKKNQHEQRSEVVELTGVANPGSTTQLLQWLNTDITWITDMQAPTVAKALEGDLGPTHRRVLELRQELALVAYKKFETALACTGDDERFRGGFKFFGAHTGRWAGRSIQLHNLPREAFTKDGAYDQSMEDAVITDLLMDNGATAIDLKRIVRPLFIVDGAVVDYAAIEARVLAWLAGESWALQAFEDGRDIYVETAERMGGMTRFQGKVATLALGYAGGVAALRRMGAEGTDKELERIRDRWREANPKTVKFWSALQQRFVGAGGKAGKVLIQHHGGNVFVVLPSGRPICYRDVRWERYRVKDPKTGQWIAKEGLRFNDPRGTGLRVGTYGGSICENVTQAVARDILAAALVRLDAAGHKVVLHIHDEIGVEGGDLDEVSKLMCELPEWASGLPMAAEGHQMKRFKKL